MSFDAVAAHKWSHWRKSYVQENRSSKPSIAAEASTSLASFAGTAEVTSSFKSKKYKVSSLTGI
jgi:hypothetical protein